jgi:hypothetical protein
MRYRNYGCIQRPSAEGRLTGIIWTAGCAVLMGASDTRSAMATPIPRAAAARMRERLFMILFSIIMATSFPLSDCVMLQNVTGLVLENDDRTVSQIAREILLFGRFGMIFSSVVAQDGLCAL